MKNTSVFLNYIKDNKKNLSRFMLLFLIGSIVGICFINKANESQMQEISSYVNSLKDNIKSAESIHKTVILIQSMKQNLLFVGIIWLLGCTLLGSFLIYIAIFYKGFSIGYTASAIIATLGVKSGTIFAMSSLLLQNLIFLPMLFIISDSGIKLYKKIRKNPYVNLKLEFLKHTAIMLITSAFAVISSFVETYVSINFLLFFKEFL